MAGTGSDWNSFMQSKRARIVMYGICVFFCVYYAVDGVMELMSPERSAVLMQSMGSTAYYIVTALRIAVCLGTGVAFGRIVLKTMAEDD